MQSVCGSTGISVGRLLTFTLDLDAIRVTTVSGLYLNGISRNLRGIRKPIAEHCESQLLFFGEIEAD